METLRAEEMPSWLPTVDWDRIKYIVKCVTREKEVKFVKCYSEDDLEQAKIELLFDDTIDHTTIEVRG
jgi:hypothetical protein